MFQNPNQSLVGQTPLPMGTQQPQTTSWGNEWFGGQNTTGYIPAGIGAISAGIGAYTGIQNYKLAQDQLDFQRQTHDQNWSNTVTLTNASLRDRQAARYSANPTAYQSPDEYMATNKVG